MSYSVFTHTTTEDMLELLGQLRALLKPKGQLAFTFTDPDYHSWPETDHGDNFVWRIKRIQQEYPKIHIDKSVEKVKNANWFTVLNQGDLYVEDESMKSYPPEIQENNYVFHKTAYIRTLFSNATIMPPVNSEMQHCFILGK